MKIKVATTFSFRADVNDTQQGERYISSSITVDPVDSTESFEEKCYCGTQNERADNVCPARAICAQQESEDQDVMVELNKARRFMIVGKPCTGKTTLARQLCEQFGCVLINVSDLVDYHLSRPTEYGVEIAETLRNGRDLDDKLICELIKHKVLSDECLEKGYVIDGIPTQSEQTSIEKQLEIIFPTKNGPEYLIDVKLTAEGVKDSPKDMCIEFSSEKVYSTESYSTVDSDKCKKPIDSQSPSQQTFENPTGCNDERLLSYEEQLAGNLVEVIETVEQQFEKGVEPFVSKRLPDSVVAGENRPSPGVLFQGALLEHTTSREHLKPMLPENINPDVLESVASAKSVLGSDVPKLVITGKPCTGKTTMARLISEAWGCQLVEASEVVSRLIHDDSDQGKAIKSFLQEGGLLTDAKVHELLAQDLRSEVCSERGFILGGLPSCSEEPPDINEQIAFLKQLSSEVDYWIIIDIDDDLLRARRSKMRVDPETGRRYSQLNYDETLADVTGRKDLPMLDEESRKRLITLPEDLPESLERHFYHYNHTVSEPLEQLLREVPPAQLIRLRGSLNIPELLKEFVGTIRTSRGLPRLTILRAIASSGEPPTVPTELLNTRAIWKDKTPRVVFLGKPCSGKTTLSIMMSQAWECQYVNASDVITRHIQENTPEGQQMQQMLSQGEDIPAELVLEIVNAELQSPICQETGYVLEDFPNITRNLSNVTRQLEFLNQLEPQPLFWVIVEISDADLRARWEAVRLNHANGAPCSQVEHKADAEPSGQCDFPYLDEETKRRLIERESELSDSMQTHVQFYNEKAVVPLEHFLERFDPASLVYLNAVHSADMLAKELSEIIAYRLNLEQVFDQPAPVIEEVKPVGSNVRFPKRTQRDGTPEPIAINHVPTTKPEDDARLSPREFGQDLLVASTPIMPTYTAPTQDTLLQRGSSGTEETCCCHCGEKLKTQSATLWKERRPHFLVIGKPCTGKTTLAKQMCAAWDCELINVSELIKEHMAMNDSFGRQINELLMNGKELDDELVFNVMSDRLSTPKAQTQGYVIDDFPTYGETNLSIQDQLKFLTRLNPPLDYIIHIQVPDDLLRTRLEKVKMDLRSGLLNVEQTAQTNYSNKPNIPTCCQPKATRQIQSTPSGGRLIASHEELAESMDANITFYHEVVEPQLLAWVDENFADKVIPMDGDTTPENMFKMLHSKLEMIDRNPTCPLSQLFTNKENAFVPGSCCKRCGIRFENLEPIPDLWETNPPRFVIFGKPCTGKSSLSRRMCNLWKCEIVNASDLIAQHLDQNTPTGEQIRAYFNSGQDLPDQFVISMLSSKLNSPACSENGFVLEGIPTHSEKSYSIELQMKFLEQLRPRPDYIIDIRVSDADLRKRWESVRIDVQDGSLYVSEMYGHRVPHPGQPEGRIVRHPDFPQVDEPTKERLITRHEELPENLDKHFEFYHENVGHQVQKYIESHDQSKVIVLQADMPPTLMFNTLLYKLNVMARNPGVPTNSLFPDEGSGQPNKGTGRSRCCRKHGVYGPESTEGFWLERPPRILILGKPCTGKTGLAQRLCVEWGCELINASEMVANELKSRSQLGNQIRETLVQGPDLGDDLVLDVIRGLFSSSKCVEKGYVLDNIPTHSELSMSIEQQLNMLRSMDNGPDYIIEIVMNDVELRDRWKAIRIDSSDGMLYAKQSYDSVEETGRRVRHPDFPVVDENVKARLLTRYEELPENLDLHFDFYHERLEEPIRRFIESHDPAAVIRVNGNQTPSELFRDVLRQFDLMSHHPGVPIDLLLKKISQSSRESSSDSCQCECIDREGQSESFKHLWKQSLPKVVVFGNSCSGKSTLASLLAKDWNCVRVNATELITQRMQSMTTMGEHLRRTMASGQDLPDQLVIELLHDALESNKCLEQGYILDDFPTSSEKAMSIEAQLDMLNHKSCAPNYIVDIRLSEDELKARWEKIRIDLADGVLYPEQSYSNDSEEVHPAFPTSKENIRQRLITRHEEIKESIQKQTDFYRDYVRPQIDHYLATVDPGRVIVVDGLQPTLQQCRTINKAILAHQRTASAVAVSQ